MFGYINVEKKIALKEKIDDTIKTIKKDDDILIKKDGDESIKKDDILQIKITDDVIPVKIKDVNIVYKFKIYIDSSGNAYLDGRSDKFDIYQLNIDKNNKIYPELVMNLNTDALTKTIKKEKISDIIKQIENEEDEEIKYFKFDMKDIEVKLNDCDDILALYTVELRETEKATPYFTSNLNGENELYKLTICNNGTIFSHAHGSKKYRYTALLNDKNELYFSNK